MSSRSQRSKRPCHHPFLISVASTTPNSNLGRQLPLHRLPFPVFDTWRGQIPYTFRQANLPRNFRGFGTPPHPHVRINGPVVGVSDARFNTRNIGLQSVLGFAWSIGRCIPKWYAALDTDLPAPPGARFKRVDTQAGTV